MRSRQYGPGLHAAGQPQQPFARPTQAQPPARPPTRVPATCSRCGSAQARRRGFAEQHSVEDCYGCLRYTRSVPIWTSNGRGVTGPLQKSVVQRNGTHLPPPPPTLWDFIEFQLRRHAAALPPGAPAHPIHPVAPSGVAHSSSLHVSAAALPTSHATPLPAAGFHTTLPAHLRLPRISRHAFTSGCLSHDCFGCRCRPPGISSHTLRSPAAFHAASAAATAAPPVLNAAASAPPLPHATPSAAAAAAAPVSDTPGRRQIPSLIGWLAAPTHRVSAYVAFCNQKDREFTAGFSFDLQRYDGRHWVNVVTWYWHAHYKVNNSGKVTWISSHFKAGHGKQTLSLVNILASFSRC